MTTVLTPVTLRWVPVFAIFYSILALSIGRLRFMSNVSLGTSRTDGSAIIVPKDSPWYTRRSVEKQDQTSETLFKVVRIHGNYGETVPLALFILFLAEINGAHTKYIHTGFTWLFIARLLHVYGTLGVHGITVPRILGHLSTQLIISLGGIYNFVLLNKSARSFI